VDQIGLIRELSKEGNGLIKAFELAKLGVQPYRIRQLMENKILERVRHGYYRLVSDAEMLSEEALIAQLFPDGVISMYSALFYHGYSDRTPMAWDIAIDKNTSKARFKLDYPYVQPYYLEPHLLTFGVTIAEYPDCEMKIFDRDRMICECLKYEQKMDRETYHKAIQAYVADTTKNIANLLSYAEKRRVLRKAKDRIGVWL
jgi:predicted transcriptional regulator of viral defense system